MVAFVRWTIFIFIGYPLQLLVFVLYPLLHFYFVLTVKRKLPRPLKAPSGGLMNPGPENLEIRDEFFMNTDDDHNALMHYGLYSEDNYRGYHGLSLLIEPDGGALRRWYPEGKVSRERVSGDCVGAWCFAFALLEDSKRPLAALERFAKHYLKHLGTTSTDPLNRGKWVSNRVNNFGLNYCPEGWNGLGQPMAGPQFWTSSALFALAAKHLGWKWKVIFWAHFWIMGGPLWVFSPVLFSKNNKLGYVRDIAARCLYAHVDVFGPRWWVMRPLKWIAEDTAEYEVALFYAMMGKMISTPLPDGIDPWHSQHVGGDMGTSPRAYPNVSKAIKKIQRKMRFRLGILKGHDYDSGLVPAGEALPT